MITSPSVKLSSPCLAPPTMGPWNISSSSSWSILLLLHFNLHNYWFIVVSGQWKFLGGLTSSNSTTIHMTFSSLHSISTMCGTPTFFLHLLIHVILLLNIGLCDFWLISVSWSLRWLWMVRKSSCWIHWYWGHSIDLLWILLFISHQWPNSINTGSKLIWHYYQYEGTTIMINVILLALRHSSITSWHQKYCYHSHVIAAAAIKALPLY